VINQHGMNGVQPAVAAKKSAGWWYSTLRIV